MKNSEYNKLRKEYENVLDQIIENPYDPDVMDDVMAVCDKLDDAAEKEQDAYHQMKLIEFSSNLVDQLAICVNNA